MQYETSMKTNGDVDDLENPASNERNESDAAASSSLSNWFIRSIIIIFIIITTGSSISPIVNDIHQNLTTSMDDMAANNKILYPITFPNIGSVSAESELLSCPYQAKVYGYDFALTSQRYRRILFQGDDVISICRKTYFEIGKGERAKLFIDGPGSSFTMRMHYLGSLMESGGMIHLTEFPYIHKDGKSHKEPAFFEYLFGFSFTEPCEEELKYHCGCVNKSAQHSLIGALNTTREHNTSAKSTSASICVEVLRVNAENLGHLPGMCVPDLLRGYLVSSYHRMRSLYPLQTSYDNSKVNIAVHIRTGYGERKGFDPSSFLNITLWLTKALRERGKNSMVHLFTEVTNKSFEAWSTFDDPANLRINSDMNRYEMFHHFVSADIIINSNSEFSHIATWPNNMLKLYLSGIEPCDIVSSLWNPCQGDNVSHVHYVGRHHPYTCQGIGVNMPEVEAILDHSFGRKSIQGKLYERK